MPTLKDSTSWKLSRTVQTVAVLVGLILCGAAFVLAFAPPVRRSLEIVTSPPSPQREEKMTEAQVDNPTVIIACFASGAALMIYALNGVRIFSFKTSVLEAGGSAPGDSSNVGNQPALGGPALAADASIDRFLVLSSWAGLKLLKACAAAAQKRKPLDLRVLGKVGNEVSYDYLYGYLIATISAGAVGGFASPDSGILTNAAVHPYVAAHIDRIIDGNIAVRPEESAWKRGDLEKLNAYLSAL